MSSPLRNSSRPALPLRAHERAVARAVAAALTALLVAGCGSLGGDTIDYRGTVVRAKPLDVPPDLTQLARDSRYQTQGGVVSAAASNVPTAAGAAPAATVAVATVVNMRIERSGQQRWLVVPTAPEQLWPQLRAFWEARGFQIAMEDAKAGVIETNWSENRGKLPNDVVRNLLGRLAGNLFDTGERDQFRTRLERTELGGKVSTEVFISHRGIEEAVLSPTGARDDNTTRWRLRPSDPQLEAEMLARLMVSLGGPQDVAAARTTVAAAPEAPARARLVVDGAAIEVDEPFDRAWRRVGLALDRGGFTVEDRDRSLGLYYVRYIDPKSLGKEEPGFWSKLFGNTDNPLEVRRFRVAVRANGPQTVVAIMNSAGAADTGENGKRVAAQLLAELR
ncbi:MAG: outer membrane protein assembly factor BamC [Rubrivivax sp.]|nr:outer membrane protein assembly factor BamC [Rubrivivax sp.]